MMLLRLLAVALLLYAGWYVLRGLLPKKRSGAASRNDAAPQDVLIEDPVCHVLIPKHQAVRLRQGEKTYYFCSEQCCDQFVAESEQQGEV
jgi:YHS domain-containing protein